MEFFNSERRFLSSAKSFVWEKGKASLLQKLGYSTQRLHINGILALSGEAGRGKMGGRRGVLSLLTAESFLVQRIARNYLLWSSKQSCIDERVSFSSLICCFIRHQYSNSDFPMWMKEGAKNLCKFVPMKL